jgi:hypothetical protein
MLVLGSRVGKSGAGSAMVRASTGVALGGGPLVDGHVGLAGDRRRVSGDCTSEGAICLVFFLMLNTNIK